MKRFFLCCLVSALLIPSASAAPEEPPAPTITLSATSAILMEKETGQILWEQDANTQMEPASVTKIMTLLLLMEAIDNGQVTKEELVTVSANASGQGGSQVYLKEGEQFPLWTLMKCVTVVSGNDASVALAEHLSGSVETFVAQMNARAADLGMTNTTFMNCTGLPAPGHMTTAHDIALMSRELILNHPDLRELTTIWMDTIRDGAFGLSNTNHLIRFYPNATGLKTGYTQSAHYCMSATAEKDGMELIAVVLNAPTSAQRFEDAKALLNYGFANYSFQEIYPSEPIPPLQVRMGTQEQIQPQLSAPCRLLLKKGEEGTVTTQIVLPEDVTAPVDSNQILGELKVFVNNDCRIVLPLMASESVPRITISGIFHEMIQKLFLIP